MDSRIGKSGVPPSYVTQPANAISVEAPEKYASAIRV
jgi:hypothetical protein